MPTETTLVLVKPDGVRRGLCGEIVSRFEHRGYELRGARLLRISRSLGDRSGAWVGSASTATMGAAAFAGSEAGRPPVTAGS